MKVKLLLLEKEIRKVLTDMFEQTPRDHEGCAFALGIESDENFEIKKIIPVPNMNVGYSFHVTQEAIDRVYELASNLDLIVVAFMHTHPIGDARLSSIDSKFLSASPIPWIVIAREQSNTITIRVYHNPISCSIHRKQSSTQLQQQQKPTPLELKYQRFSIKKD
jgi:proteasome lid subunit RPN8/RPN11